MKKKNFKRGMAAALSAMMIMSGFSAYAGELGTAGGTGFGNDVITAPNSLVGTTGDVVALDDIGISITASDYISIIQSEGFVYVYTMEDGSMPYVIIGKYDAVDDNFADAFTVYMSSVYSDLDVNELNESVMLDGLEFSRIVYNYTVSGYTVKDTRLFYGGNGYTYMFGAKEVPELAMNVPSGYLEKIASSMAPLAGGDGDYEKHVDSTRSVTGSVFQAAGGFGGAGDDLSDDTDDDDVSVPTEGTVGGTVGGVGNTGTDTQDDTEGGIVFDESKAGFAGAWVTFEDGFKLYLPSSWQSYEISEYYQQLGALYMAGDASGALNAPYIEVDWAKTEGVTTLSGLSSELTAAGYTVDGTISINGIQCIAYRNDTQDLTAIMFFHPMTTDYVFVVIGKPYAANVDTLAAILCSLTPTN